jgi:hypothetical protein
MSRKPQDLAKQQSFSKLAYGVLILLWGLIVYINIKANNNQTISRYHLSQNELHEIFYLISLPILLIWISILYATLNIRRYSISITDSKESPGFRNIANGLFMLLVSLVVTTFLGGLQSILSQNAADPSKVRTNFIIVSNYVAVVAALATYGFLLRGSQLLLRSIGKRLNLSKQMVPLILSFVVLTAAYLFLIHSNPTRQMSADQTINPTFGLSYWMIVLTVALPFIVSWLLGISALIGLYRYNTAVKGSVYRFLFRRLLTGMTIVIGLTIILQLLTQLSNINDIKNVSTILSIISVLYLILIYTFFLIVQGVKQLDKIETVSLE